MPDCDVFARANRPARAAATVLVGMLGTNDDASDPATPELNANLLRTVNTLLHRAEAVASLDAVLEQFERWREDDAGLLFARQDPEERITVVERIVRERGTTQLDLVLGRAATRSLLHEVTDPERIARQFVEDVLCRWVADARGGLLDELGAAERQRIDPQLRASFAPVVDAASRALIRNPNARRVLASRDDSSGAAGSIDPMSTNLLTVNS